MWESMQSDDEDLGERVLQTRLAVTHAVHESERAINMLYHASGTNAVRSSNLLERYFRDVNAAMMHAGGLLANFEQGGRVAPRPAARRPGVVAGFSGQRIRCVNRQGQETKGGTLPERTAQPQ